MNVVMNESIKEKNVLLIDHEGKNHGKVGVDFALDLAYENDMDLVLVGDGVCKIMDYAKVKYEQKKKARENKKESVVKWKEIQLSVTIGDHDLGVKANQAKRLMDKGNKIKVVLPLKGRMITHKELGTRVIDRFKEILGDVVIEKDVFFEGNKVVIHISK